MLLADNVGRRYRRGRPWAVRNLNFELPQGSITALVGPNGAGKSTLIRQCIGFEPLDEGDVTIAGVRLRANRGTALRQLAYVPQSSGLYQRYTVSDHFELAWIARPSFSRSLAVKLLDAARIDVGQQIGELSGGEQAQVALAIAIATRAPLLLFDEPLAGLDPLARRDFLTVLMENARNANSTVVISSHLVRDIEHVCDRILVLAQGKLVLDMAVAAAMRSFRVVGEGDVESEVIGRFAGDHGELLALVHDSYVGGTSPTLEDIVLGHLARSRRA